MKSPRELMRQCLELFHQGRIDEASQFARDSVQEFPDDGDLWQLQGLLLQGAGDYDGACDALETAGLLVPLSPVAQCALADCHARAGRKELAWDLYRALARNRSCPTALLASVAAGLGCLGDALAALDACRELSRRDPANHQAFFGIAYYMQRSGHDTATILPAIAQAHKLRPESPTYRILMASLLAQLGRYEEACTLLRDVRPETVRCSGCLRRIMAILDRGDDDFLTTFRAHFEQIASSPPENTP